MRYLIWQRDKGICAQCGQDPSIGKFHRNDEPRANTWYRTGDLWQVDHIMPVVEGGGECGLSNLRTLCTECHRKETAELARRRAAARSKQMRLV